MKSARKGVKIPPWPARLLLNTNSPMPDEYEEQAQYKLQLYFSHLQRELEAFHSEPAMLAVTPPPPPPLPPATTLAAKLLTQFAPGFACKRILC